MYLCSCACQLHVSYWKHEALQKIKDITYKNVVVMDG